MRLLAEWSGLLRREFSGYGPAQFQMDFLAALTVAAVALPLALAFGVASGADAAAGLVTAVLAGIVIGGLGGAPYQISGPTGAMSAVLIVLSSRYGLQAVWVVGVMAGLMMILAGVLRLGRVVSLIPAPVISGFTSGVATIIVIGQLDNALGIDSPAVEGLVGRFSYYAEHLPELNPHSLAIAGLVFVVMASWPCFKPLQRVPGSLAGISVATLAAHVAGWQTPVIGEIPRSILLSHRFQLAGIPWSDLDVLVVPAMSVAALGMIESLLCGAVAGNMTGFRLHSRVELVAQGIGNLLIPFFGGVPATAAIARTSVGIKSGGRTRLTPVLHGLILLLIVLLAAPLLMHIPLAALAGVLIVTAWRMNEWPSIRFYFGRRLKHAMAAFLVTFAATVCLDLTQAIVIGFGLSTLVFVAQMSDLQISRRPVNVGHLIGRGHRFTPPDRPVSVYYLSGPLFFGASRKLIESVEELDEAGAILTCSLRGVPLVDATGIEVFRELVRRQRKSGGELILAALQPRVEALLQRSGVLDEIGRHRIFWSADQAILSVGAEPPKGEPEAPAPEPSMDSTLILTPHQDRVERRK